GSAAAHEPSAASPVVSAAAVAAVPVAMAAVAVTAERVEPVDPLVAWAAAPGSCWVYPVPTALLVSAVRAGQAGRVAPPAPGARVAKGWVVA
ncbi:MAG: hypothetical protein K2X56_21600, partial [Mycobacterium pseudokansasii]|uniref:hypothetical protein n=1 Tax=Mycobacterium pseudokansasii TaxID=2341080 RepID=UPI0023F47C58